MARVLICSYNKSILDKCSEALANDHELKLDGEFDLDCKADVIILDTDLVDNNSQVLSFIKRFNGHILLTGTNWSEEKQVEAMIHLASGYYDQNEPPHLLQKAVMSILKGEIWINRQLVPKVIHSFSLINPSTNDSPPEASSSAELLKTLSSRELDVAKLVSQGENNKQIASALFISERTVKAHLTSIFRKLNVSDRLHLAVLLREHN